MAIPTSMTATRRPGRVLTASARKVIPRQPSTYRDRQTWPWQKQAFLYARLIPELNYASRFYAKMLTKLLIYPALRKPDDTTEKITTGLPVDLLDRIQDPGGGRSRILGSYGRLMFMIGDGYLFGREIGRPRERWMFVNPDELQITEDGIAWKSTMGGDYKKLPKATTEAYRMWTPDPEFSGEAESPMRAGIYIAQELDLLTKAVNSTAVSRMINGILKVPQELSFGADEEGMDDDPEANPLLQEMIDHFAGAMENAGTAEGRAAWILEGAWEFLDRLEWMPLHDPTTDYMEQAMRKEAIDRLAIGMDLPPEILKGMAEANHWGARQIMHDTWRSHGSVVAEQFCDDLADAYLRPALEAEGYENWQNVVVGYDDSNVVVPPDRTDDADKAHDRITISDEAHRKLKGFGEEMAPDEEETRIRLALKLRDVRLLKGTKYEVEEPEPEQTVDGIPGPDPSTDAPQDAEESPPAPGPAGTSREESRTSILSRSSIIHGAAEMALYRCREVAGNRIRQKFRTISRSSPELDQIDGKQNCHVAAILGHEAVARIGVAPLSLVKGGADGFHSLLVTWGFDESQARVLSEMISVYSAKTLFEPVLPQLPSGFLAQVERMRELAVEQAVVDQNNDSLARLTELLPGVGIKG